MTTIAWDGWQLAGDSCAATGGGTVNRVVKIGALNLPSPRPYIGHPPMVLFGVSGRARSFIVMTEFLTGHSNTLDLGGHASALICSEIGSWLWERDRPIALISGAKAAIGSGADAALGAMFVGATAAKAIEVAAMVDCFTQLPVQAFSLPGERGGTIPEGDVEELPNDEP